MRVVVLVALAIVVSGCSAPPPSVITPSTPVSSTQGVVTSTRPVDVLDCVAADLTADRASFAWGENVTLNLTLTNCSASPRTLSPRCDQAETLRTSITGQFVFLTGDPIPRPAPPDGGPCDITGSIAGAGSWSTAWVWNGSVAYQGACLNTTCDIIAPAEPGNVTIFAQGNANEQSQVTVRFDAPSPCANLTVLATPTSSTSGEAFEIHVVLRNCGVAPLVVKPRSDCWGSRALTAALTRDGHTWWFDEQRFRDELPHENRARLHSMGYCIGGFGQARAALAPGASLDDRYLWNGTLAEDDECPEPGGGSTGSVHLQRAIPGNYTLAATFAPADQAELVTARNVTLRYFGT